MMDEYQDTNRIQYLLVQKPAFYFWIHGTYFGRSLERPIEKISSEETAHLFQQVTLLVEKGGQFLQKKFFQTVQDHNSESRCKLVVPNSNSRITVTAPPTLTCSFTVVTAIQSPHDLDS